ncbi:MAG: ROK family protein [Firmicutes bacterium]|nr:ROK family protein [Bacillota bacterium]
MSSKSGANQQTVKAANRGLVLEQVLNKHVVSRAEIARTLGLTKTTLTNITNELIAEGILTEVNPVENVPGRGRRAIELGLSENAPKICGVMIRRGSWRVILADLTGQIIKSVDYFYEGLVTPAFLEIKLKEMLAEIMADHHQRILAAGIACLGPLNIKLGRLLSPQQFFTEPEDFDIVSLVESATGLKAYLCNDATAGALAEKLFGQGKNEENFMYISTLNGIGAGFYLENKLYNGETGQNGELGHMSINFMGPQCSCGNRGCLELYADVQRILNSNPQYHQLFPGHTLLEKKHVTILDVMDFLENEDPLAMDVMSRYCQYLACAVSNLITQLNINRVILAGAPGMHSHFMEEMLAYMINQKTFVTKYCPITVVRSDFGCDSPLYGSVGVVLEKIFRGGSII